MLTRHICHIIRTKGRWHAVERAAEVVLRFVGGRRRFRRRLPGLKETFIDQGVRVTFCVTASLLDRHRDLVEDLRGQGHEIAAHGHVHTRMDLYDRQAQDRQIHASYEAFRRAGIPAEGFRCPYLNFNADTNAGLQASNYGWTSGEMVWWEDGQPVKEGVERLRDLYQFIPDTGQRVLPRVEDRLVHIPITAPDDELLYERQRVRQPADLVDIWWRSFQRHHEEGGLHHQFFHPERFDWIRPALNEVIRKVNALGPEVWKPTLTELADWWRQNHPQHPSNPLAPLASFAVNWPQQAKSCFTISADICAFDLRDFIDRAKRF